MSGSKEFDQMVLFKWNKLNILHSCFEKVFFKLKTFL